MAQRDLFTRIRTRRAAMVAAGGLILGGVVAVPAAMAGTTPPFDNAIDGEDIGDGFSSFPDPSGNSRELGPVNGSTTKLGVIHRADPPMLAPTNPNAQTDLNEIWLGSGTDSPDGDTWLYFAWKRDSSNGSGVIMYEFQKDGAPAGCDYSGLPGTSDEVIAACNPWENRQAGDFVLVWDQVGSDPQNVQIILRTWSGPSGYDQPLSLSAGDVITGTDYAYADLASDGFAGEAAVNLSQTVWKNQTASCQSIGNVIPGTVTGNSDTADYKDTVLTGLGNLNISNCGTVIITKDTDPEGGTGIFNYTLDRVSGDVRYPSVSSVSDTLTEDGDSETERDLIPGTNYRLEEQMGANTPYQFDKLECTQPGGSTYAEVTTTFSVEAAKTTNCLITNSLLPGTLVVNKVVVTGDGGEGTTADYFKFKVDQGDGNGFGDDQTFDEDADEDGNDETGTWSQTYAAGTQVNVVENDYSPAWATTYSDDYDGNDPEEGEDPAECLGLVIPAGGTVTCTITNDDQQGTLIVNKVVANNYGGDGTAGDFTFKVNNGANQSFDEEADEDGDPETGTRSQAVDAGTYSVVENDPSGLLASYSASYADDYAGNDPDEGEDPAECLAMEIGLGETVTCTITNTDSQNSPGLGRTVQSWLLRDSFSLTGIRPGADDQNDATVTFRLYADATLQEGSTDAYICSAQVGDPIVVDALASDYSADGADFVRLDVEMAVGDAVEVTESGDYYWTAQYSGDAYNAGGTTPCGAEKTEILAKDQFVEEEGDPPVFRDDFAD